jgi:hypothetical protein
MSADKGGRGKVFFVGFVTNCDKRKPSVTNWVCVCVVKAFFEFVTN